MTRAELAQRLVNAANNRERRRLLSDNRALADTRLAGQLRKTCYAIWTTDPVRARHAAAAMSELVKIDRSAETAAVHHWVSGIADITRGRFEPAIEELSDAGNAFNQLGLDVDAAQTQVAKLLALAMVGRYDDAVRTGREALTVFVRTGDELAAGKIEMNLSNVVARRERHREAEQFALSARRRFAKAGERTWQTMAENDLANTYTEINEFDKAEQYYRLALEGARSEKMNVTEAEIEASLGNLARIQGKYGDALRYLEMSRQRYEQLAMPHQSAIADLEIADIYAELNLGTEAAAIYERVSKTFGRLRLTAEEARSRLNHGRAAARLGQNSPARRELRRALLLFEREGNEAGQVSALLSLSRLELHAGNLAAGRELLTVAAAAIKRTENPRHRIHFDLLDGELLMRSGQGAAAEQAYRDALAMAKLHRHPTAAEFAHNALGKAAAARGDVAGARAEYKLAIRTIEEMRSSLTNDFSMAFFAARLAPYESLARLFISHGRIKDAFRYIEAGRSRSLLDSLAGHSSDGHANSPLEKDLNEFRSELNAHYKRLDIAGVDESRKLRKAALDLEKKITSTTRRIKSFGSPGEARAAPSLTSLQQRLGSEATLVEFVELDNTYSAFVVTGTRLEYVTGLGTTDEIRRCLEELRFQFGSLRYGVDIVHRFGKQLKGRTDAVLGRLYDILLERLTGSIKGTRLIIIPSGLPHYVPFHALHDGEHYLAESVEMTYAPSAAVWQALDEKTRKPAKTSLIVGYADEKIPLVEDEIEQISKMLPAAKKLTGEKAAFSAIMDELGRYDLLHFACHGEFRADNPMFSSLHLADGWVTVNDVIARRLRAQLVTLSACETGLNELVAGDEILGLARGFLAAGAQNLIVSLWSVNDQATGRLMGELYKNLQRGSSVAASLRGAQMGFIERGEHPYLWSPFVLIGR